MRVAPVIADHLVCSIAAFAGIAASLTPLNRCSGGAHGSHGSAYLVPGENRIRTF